MGVGVDVTAVPVDVGCDFAHFFTLGRENEVLVKMESMTAGMFDDLAGF